MRQRWNKAIVIEKIQNLHRNGKKLNPRYVRAHYQTLGWAAYKYFGGWRQAVEAAGLDYTKIRKIKPPQRWSKKIIKETILELHAAGEKLNSNYVQLNRKVLYAAAWKYFGSWAQAVKSVGLDYNRIRVKKDRRWSKKAIVQAIRARERKAFSLNGGMVSLQDRGLYNAARRHFGRGGWQKALKKAGCGPLRIAWTRSRVIREIRTLHAAGHPIYSNYLKKNRYGSLYEGGRKVFGPWRRAVEAAGFDYDEARASYKGSWMKRKVIAELRKLERQGVRLSLKAIRKTRADLISAAIRLFGSWSQAVEAAGISYRVHSLNWSYKAWLRTLRPWEVQKLQQQTLHRAKVRRITQ